jgi:crotonobetainyl-CoA:carnitine CoA-transferase CaiB-like acyl-CoA transferase
MKKPEAVAIAQALAARSDIIVENFATGVMDRLGLGADDLQALNPDLLYVSASGLGRTGPEARAVAYGTLLQCCAGFAGLNRHPDVPPRVGLAWLDPMCGLMLAFIVAAGLWHRRWAGGVARIDFSMIEAVSSTSDFRTLSLGSKGYRKAVIRGSAEATSTHGAGQLRQMRSQSGYANRCRGSLGHFARAAARRAQERLVRPDGLS